MAQLKPYLVFLVGYGYIVPAYSCEMLDASYAPIGHVVSTDNQTNGNVAHLGSMLGTRYVRKVGDPKIHSLRLRIDRQLQRLKIINELEQGLQGPIYEYDVVCSHEDWIYSESGRTGAEGISREYEITVRLKLLPNGDVEVRNEKTIIRGTIFKSKSSVSVIAHFPQKR